ncbi:MAG: hypothetical protein H6832_11055 [Planctomycetes bacterium]|nr:hypothetical protein [Planctomycetota bacterium]MCB9891161.1 hypothetical protein [Planctomycetota bacterium]MCB9918928.1 hypothetical protein [Planctomycetota bacterium]
MQDTGIVPDFITVDGEEDGTGAAPLEDSDSVGMPLAHSLPRVHAAREHHVLRSKVRLLASRKIITALDVLEALALGADACSRDEFLRTRECLTAVGISLSRCCG